MSKIKIEVEVDACDLCNKELGISQRPMEIIDTKNDNEIVYVAHIECANDILLQKLKELKIKNNK